jgi:hypothetical protein
MFDLNSAGKSPLVIPVKDISHLKKVMRKIKKKSRELSLLVEEFDNCCACGESLESVLTKYDTTD